VDKVEKGGIKDNNLSTRQDTHDGVLSNDRRRRERTLIEVVNEM